ncbi:hypothetical protein SK854_43865 [Lentzea sp. BCCO 10_0061]|uniref:Uncharacterized protein n=1 Tax=Lentzea sokolovensis TaxID=3095429 RepID=A0ABU4VBF4_9PSEU|nr:hypothetical protein [Lentzea sp. BCCO 10_0061]MDX8149122.1 hypothetical protein [Lentzea sp. BCCO 10_0061]
MRNQLTTGRRFAVVIALMLIAVFVLHPACPPEPTHHGAFTPGISGEFCHHGQTHHASPAAPAQAAVQISPLSFTVPDADDEHVVRPARAARPPSRGEHVTAGRTLLLDLGISRT